MGDALCRDGTQQSPIQIDIGSRNIMNCAPNCDLKFFYKSSDIKLDIGEKDVVLTYDSGSYIIYNQTIYSLNRIDFFSPSLHKLINDNTQFQFEGEAILYHQNSDSGKIIALSVLLKTANNSSASSMFFAAIPRFNRENIGDPIISKTNDTWNAFQLLPPAKSFFKYTGSLLSDPCTENITWIVFENEVSVPATFIDDLRLFKNDENQRKLQPLNSRIIYYNSNEDPSNNRNNITNEVCITNEKLEQIKEDERKKYEKVVNMKSAYEQKKMGYIIAMSVLLGVFILFLVIYKLFTKFKGKSNAPPPTQSSSGGSNFLTNASNLIKVAANGLIRTTQELNNAVN